MNDNEKISILHLSDLHFSSKIEEDIDAKESIEVNTKSEKLDKFKEYIKGLPSKPDYVVVSGDITVKGKADGFRIFNRIIIDLIKKHKLPSVDRFIVVPGNHDVKAGATLSDSKRWDDYKSLIGSKYLIPWLVGIDQNYETMTELIDKEINKKSSVIGGIVSDSDTGERCCIPFLLDEDKKVLFYAFNSSILSQTKIVDDSAKEILEYARKYKKEDKDFLNLVNKYEEQISIDPARVIGDEIKLFIYSMEKIKKLLKNDYGRYLKIAVLHHHISSLYCNEEIKKFELLLNSGIFKRTLVDYGFNVVLHGHKHWNEVFWDTAVSEGGALLVVSGGTICGTPCKNKKAGFYYLDFNSNDKTVETYYYEMNDSYRIKYDEDNGKRIFSYDTANKHIGLIDEVHHYNAIQICNRVKQSLLSNIHTRKVQNIDLCGWSRIIDTKGKVGMIATACGLIIASRLQINDISFLEKKNEIIDSLWQFRLPNGGFSALSEADIASVEATVWATRAFYVIPSITTLTLALDLLCECDPQSHLLDALKEAILKKAIYENGRIVYWPYGFGDRDKDSPIYTIRSVISLSNYSRIRGTHDQFADDLQSCGEWIMNSKWDNIEEIICRHVTLRREDRLVYQHYSAPLAIIAVLRLGFSKKEKKIVNELIKILNTEHNGLWSWNSRYNYPIWAIHDVLQALNEYTQISII